MTYHSSSASDSISPAGISPARSNECSCPPATQYISSQAAAESQKKGTNTAPGPSIPCLAFGDNRRRRSLALAVVPVVLPVVLRAAGDAQKCKHRCYWKSELLHKSNSSFRDALTVTKASSWGRLTNSKAIECFASKPCA